MDMGWLASEAKQIHAVFSELFYSVILTLMLLGVVMNYFRMPMGQVPEFLTLVGRAIVAAFLLVSLPEIMNRLADVTDQFSKSIGDLHNFKLVVSRLGEKLGDLTWSWVSVKDSVLLLVSYVSFFLLYITVYMADTLFVFTWMMLYVFSPVLIAAFVLPSTAQATKGLFQALIEVCIWKVTWSVLAALLWSFALSKINDPSYGVDFLTAILLNFLLAFSVVVTPMIVRGLLQGGLHSAASSLGGAILGVAALTPGGMLGVVKQGAARAVGQFRPSAGRKGEPGGPQSTFSRRSGAPFEEKPAPEPRRSPRIRPLIE
jgi:hypothetical protein